MSTEDKDSLQSKVEDAGKEVINQNVNKAKGEAKNLLDKVAFWKKEKTPEEKQADVQKKYEKIEKKYQKALKQAVYAETEDEKKLAEEKAAKKREKSLKELQEKYPEQWAVIQGQKQQGTATVENQSESVEAEAPVKKKKTFWQRITAWTRKKTPEERQEACEKKLEKAQAKYEKALTKAAKAKTDEKKAAKAEKAIKAYNKRLQKIEKKYPAEIQNMRDAAAKAAAERKAAEEKAAAEKTEAEKMAAAQQRLESRVNVSNAVKEAKGKVATPTEERKMATLKKWMKEVHLPEENAQKMIDKYGVDMAYRLTQRCMLEPDHLMPEIDSSFKKIQNKSSKSIQYFLDLDTEKADNKAKVSKVTNLPFIEKEDTKSKGTQGAETGISLGVATQQR